jgi:hypothetical protein
MADIGLSMDGRVPLRKIAAHPAGGLDDAATIASVLTAING